ncbi:unnamed protein product [Arctogadus glacialis]
MDDRLSFSSEGLVRVSPDRLSYSSEGLVRVSPDCLSFSSDRHNTLVCLVHLTVIHSHDVEVSSCSCTRGCRFEPTDRRRNSGR